MAEDPNDSELVRRVAEGDRDALARLYDRFCEEMMSVGMKFLDDESVAEEVIHDVFLEVWRNAHEYDASRGSVRTWLMVRMRSRALDKVRYEGRRAHERLEDAADDNPMLSDEDPSEDLEHDWVRRTVADLSERLRNVLVCTYFHGMTGPETAERLDIPVGTVRSRLAAARRELRDRIDTTESGTDE